MSATFPYTGHTVSGPTTIDAEEDVAVLLDALNDTDCRAIIEATDDESLTASELSETCDLPLSTTYRKLDMLTDAGIVEKGTRIRRSGKHTSEFSLQVEDIVVSVGTDTGISLEVTRRETPQSYPYPQAVGGL